MGGPASPRLRSGRRSEVHSAKEGGEKGEARVLLRSRADKATAKQNTASEQLRPTGTQGGAMGLPVELHIGGRFYFLSRRFVPRPARTAATIKRY